MDLEQTVEEFRRDGFSKIPGLLAEGKLHALQHDTQHIIDGGYEEVANPTDYRTAPDPDTGEEVFNRVQFGLDAARGCAAGCGHAHRRHLGPGADSAHAACHRDPQGVSLRGGGDFVRLPGPTGIRA